MNRIGVGERLRPQPVAPFHRELLRQFLARELEAVRACFFVDELQVPEFVEKDPVEQESAEGQCRPLPAPPSPELLGRPATGELAGSARGGRSNYRHCRRDDWLFEFGQLTVD